AKERQRDGEHDDQRLQQALELRGHDYINEKEAQEEREIEAALAALKLLVLPGDRKIHLRRPVNLGAQHFLDALHRAAERALRDVRLHERHAAAIHAADFART